jgi:hypothetical protein
VAEVHGSGKTANHSRAAAGSRQLADDVGIRAESLVRCRGGANAMFVEWETPQGNGFPVRISGFAVEGARRRNVMYPMKPKSFHSALGSCA